MAVVQADIKADLLELYNDAKAAPMTEDTFAGRMATIIADAILSADVTTTVEGTLPAGPVAATGSGGLT